MPDRVIRDELLESERWLTLKDNADRLAYISLLLLADDYGNYSAEPYRLMRMWRDFGIGTIALVAKTLSELADHDLVRLYEAQKKPYLNIPRFKNARRYWSRKFPKSPFNEQVQTESNQSHTEKPAADLRQTCANPSGGVGVGVGVGEEKPKTKNKAQAPFVLPEEIPKMQWDAWLESRAKARKTPTDFAKRLAVGKLLELAEQGHHPAAVLAQSAFNGWSGLFPLKEQK
jgi:hypothetical protein